VAATRGGSRGLPSQAYEDPFDHRLLKDGGDELQLARKMTVANVGKWPSPGTREGQLYGSSLAALILPAARR